MACGICERKFSTRRKPFCPSCAKAILTPPRIEQAAALLGREKAHTHVEAIVRPGNDGILAALPEDADWDAITAGLKTHSSERVEDEKEAVLGRVREITERAEQLRREIEEHKAWITSREEVNTRRRNDLAKEHTQLQKHMTRTLEPIHAATRKARHRLNKVHGRTAEAREYLCKEASSLSGLKKARTAEGKMQYLLSGLPLPSLKELNGINGKITIAGIDLSSGEKPLVEPPELISASMDNLSRFLGICCHYLSVRLPAEIILPHNHFPHAAVLPINSSYKSGDPRYSGSGSQTPSPAASRIMLRNDLSRPRLLQLDRPLPQLLKEDPKTAAFFIEGIALLAYDLAWLCRTQGAGPLISFDDVCDLGQNLHRLFPGKDDKSRPALNRNVSSAVGRTERSFIDNIEAQPRLGSYSHGSARHSLAGYESYELFLDWKTSVTKLTDQVKSYLRNETARAEWHFVDDTEWGDELENEQPVLVGGARRSLDSKGPAMSIMPVLPSYGEDDDSPGPSSAPRGQSGWMKVRGRGGES